MMSNKYLCWCLAMFGGIFILMANDVGAAENPYGEVSVPLNLEQVPDKPVYYALGTPGVPDSVNEGHTSNAGFVITDEGVVVYDALGTPALGYELLRAIGERTGQPVKIVVAGHYHADHIYGLQAFKEHSQAEIWAHVSALGYAANGTDAVRSEDAERRLQQRREALFPWVDENTYVVAPDHTFEKQKTFELGGLHFDVVYLGPGHSPEDSIMLVRELGVVFSGDLIFEGRVPFLDSPEVDTANWLEGLDFLLNLQPPPGFVIPGHGPASGELGKRLQFTRDYIDYLRTEMGKAAEEMMPFDEAYEQTDWSDYQDLPAFDASNRGNAYRVFLEMEANSF